MKVTDKAFIVRIRRALKDGASIDAIKSEFELYRENRISEACAKAADPLAVCKNVLRHAKKISPNGHVFHSPFTDDGGEVFISDGRGVIISVPRKYAHPRIAEKAKIASDMAKKVSGMFEKGVKTHPVDTVVIHRGAVESWLADVDVNQPVYNKHLEWEKYAVIVFDGVALDARKIKLCFDYTGEEKLKFEYWKGKNGLLKCVCTQSPVTCTRFMFSVITDKMALADICKRRELHELPVTLTCKITAG